MVTILISAKLDILGQIKKVFLNEGYDVIFSAVIFSAYNGTNKTFQVPPIIL